MCPWRPRLLRVLAELGEGPLLEHRFLDGPGAGHVTPSGPVRVLADRAGQVLQRTRRPPCC
eukprot:8754770-Pyramimonas_sp.AAC.1